MVPAGALKRLARSPAQAGFAPRSPVASATGQGAGYAPSAANRPRTRAIA